MLLRAVTFSSRPTRRFSKLPLPRTPQVESDLRLRGIRDHSVSPQAACGVWRHRGQGPVASVVARAGGPAQQQASRTTRHSASSTCRLASPPIPASASARAAVRTSRRYGRSPSTWCVPPAALWGRALPACTNREPCARRWPSTRRRAFYGPPRASRRRCWRRRTRGCCRRPSSTRACGSAICSPAATRTTPSAARGCISIVRCVRLVPPPPHPSPRAAASRAASGAAAWRRDDPLNPAARHAEADGLDEGRARLGRRQVPRPEQARRALRPHGSAQLREEDGGGGPAPVAGRGQPRVAGAIPAA